MSVGHWAALLATIGIMGAGAWGALTHGSAIDTAPAPIVVAGGPAPIAPRIVISSSESRAQPATSEVTPRQDDAATPRPDWFATVTTATRLGAAAASPTAVPPAPAPPAVRPPGGAGGPAAAPPAPPTIDAAAALATARAAGPSPTVGGRADAGSAPVTRSDQPRAQPSGTPPPSAGVRQAGTLPPAAPEPGSSAAEPPAGGASSGASSEQPTNRAIQRTPSEQSTSRTIPRASTDSANGAASPRPPADPANGATRSQSPSDWIAASPSPEARGAAARAATRTADGRASAASTAPARAPVASPEPVATSAVSSAGYSTGAAEDEGDAQITGVTPTDRRAASLPPQVGSAGGALPRARPTAATAATPTDSPVDRPAARAAASAPPAESPEATSRPRATPRPPGRRTPRPAWTPRPPWPTRSVTPGPTRTARPITTPAVTPRPTFVAPPPRNGANKWGVGVYRDSNRVIDLIRETQPGVILLMDPTEGWARRVRETAPNAFIVGRRFRVETDQPLDHPDERGVEFADWVAELAVPLRGVVDAWMSYNEVLRSDPSEDYPNFNRFQVAFAHRLQDVYGVAAVAGNDGSGALDPEDYPTYFAEAIRASQYFGVHAYSPPRTSSMQQDAEWNALRYRKIHDGLERIGIRDKKFVITESGLGDGFRGGIASDEQMADDFAWFTRELQRDAYVIGHAAFGLFDATGAWNGFDLTESAVPRRLPDLLRPARP